MKPVGHIWEPITRTLRTQDREKLEQFFRHTLLIKDIASDHIVTELRELSELCDKDSTYSLAIDLLRDIYQSLDALREGMDESSLLILK